MPHNLPFPRYLPCSCRVCGEAVRKSAWECEIWWRCFHTLPWMCHGPLLIPSLASCRLSKHATRLFFLLKALDVAVYKQWDLGPPFQFAGQIFTASSTAHRREPPLTTTPLSLFSFLNVIIWSVTEVWLVSSRRWWLITLSLDWRSLTTAVSACYKIGAVIYCFLFYMFASLHMRELQFMMFLELND